MDLRHRIAEFNACIPYSGIAASVKPDPALMLAILSLLPQSGSSGMSTPRLSGSVPLHLTSKDAIHLIDLLHCLQRLATSTFVAAAILNIQGTLLETWKSAAVDIGIPARQGPSFVRMMQIAVRRRLYSSPESLLKHSSKTHRMTELVCHSGEVFYQRRCYLVISSTSQVYPAAFLMPLLSQAQLLRCRV